MFKLFDPILEYVFDLDSSCNFSKLQHNSLAFVAGLKRATDEGSLPEIAQYSPYYLPLNVLLLPKDQTFFILFTETTHLLGPVVSCLFRKFSINLSNPPWIIYPVSLSNNLVRDAIKSFLEFQVDFVNAALLFSSSDLYKLSVIQMNNPF